MINFKKDFFWGGAVSAEQTEGLGLIQKGKTVFQKHFEDRPKDFYNEIGPNQAIEETFYFDADAELIKKLGLNSHRTSISWARIFPEGDYTKPNKDALEFYHDLIDSFTSKGIELFLTLYHFDMPQYALDKGGFESREVWRDFQKYCEFVLNEFSSKIKYWTTMNEPWVPVQASYIAGIQPPFKKEPQAAINAAYGIIMCHVNVVNFFNKVIKKKNPKCQIGGIFNSTIVYPKDKTNQKDVDAALYYDLFQFKGLMDPCVGGFISDDMKKWLKQLGLFPKNFKLSDVNAIKSVKLDFVGLNFYAPARVQAPKLNKAKNIFEKYFSMYDMPGRRENKFRGWEIYPEAIYDTLTEIKNRYKNVKKVMLTEFGMGVQKEDRFRNKEGYIEDDYRISFLKEHLVHLHRFIKDNQDINVMGAHAWATFDCWSWNNAFKNTYGLIEVDLKTMKRIPKKSSLFLGELAKTNKFHENFLKMEELIDMEDDNIEKSIKL